MRTSTLSVKAKRPIFRLWAILFWLLVWQGASMALSGGLLVLLPSPLETARSLFSLLPTVPFWQTVGFTAARILGGFFLSVVLAVPLAALAHRFPCLLDLLHPLTAAMTATPVASFTVIALLWLPAANLSFLIAFLMAFPPLYCNVLEGIKGADWQLLELGQVFQVPLSRRLWGIYLPAVLPHFRSGCALALGLAWKSGVAAELIGLPQGSIGERLYDAKVYFESPALFAWTVTIILLAALCQHVFLALTDAMSRRWKGGL